MGGGPLNSIKFGTFIGHVLSDNTASMTVKGLMCMTDPSGVCCVVIGCLCVVLPHTIHLIYACGDRVLPQTADLIYVCGDRVLPHTIHLIYACGDTVLPQTADLIYVCGDTVLPLSTRLVLSSLLPSAD